MRPAGRHRWSRPLPGLRDPAAAGHRTDRFVARLHARTVRAEQCPTCTIDREGAVSIDAVTQGADARARASSERGWFDRVLGLPAALPGHPLLWPIALAI